jgi:hypothetical protein
MADRRGRSPSRTDHWLYERLTSPETLPYGVCPLRRVGGHRTKGKPSRTYFCRRGEESLGGRRAPLAKANHFISSKTFRASPNNASIRLRSAIASLVNRPCLRAFWFDIGAPDPCAPPCMRQRFLPCTAGERHAPAERVLAPQRGLASIGPVF